MFLLLLKNMLRSRIILTGLATVFIAGLLSIQIGRQFLQQHEETIARTAQVQQEHLQRNVPFFRKETGLLLYYLRFGLVNRAHPLSGFAIGQRDVHAAVQRVTIRGLEAQKYDTDLFNPASLLAGNLDLGFVLLYLFPLLIISFSYNLLSEEKEAGTWRLVAAQTARPARVLLLKWGIVALLVGALWMVLFCSAVIALSLPPDAALGAVLLLSLLYLLCWMCLSLFVVSLQRTSSSNAVLLLGCWLLFTIVLPGAVNSFLIRKYPVPEALATAVKQREGYHEKWDQDKQTALEPFYAHYPQFRKYGVPGASFSWLWYYAMQQTGDDEARAEALELNAKLWSRERASGLIARWVPTLHAQHQLTTLARSGLRNHLNFMDQTGRFHEGLRLYFYPRIFDEVPATEIDWNRFKVAFFEEQVKVGWWEALSPLLLFSLLFGAGAFRKLRSVEQVYRGS